MKSRKKLNLNIALILIIILSNFKIYSQTSEISNDQIDPSQVESIDGIVNAVYDLISAKPGERNWASFRALFLPDARIISIKKDNMGADSFYNMHIDEYIATIGPVIKDQTYYEIEIGRQLDEYHNIASVFSTFQSTLITEGEITVKNGINSIQLVFYNQRWWISNVLWNNETKENLIPAKYKIPEKKMK